MKHEAFSRLLHLLLGAFWAFVIAGALIIFKLFIVFGYSTAVFVTFVYVFFALFIVLALDSFVTNKQRLKEAKKQTELLERILSRLQNESND